MPFILGLDLGQQNDPTALAVLEQTPTHLDVRHLERWQLQTRYTDIVRDVARMCSRPELKDATLAVDWTGVGRAVVDQLWEADLPVNLVPITITAGHRAAQAEDGVGFRVPKKDLVSAVQVALGYRRLRWAKTLPLAELLGRELSNFRVKVTAAANETFSAWREGDHDDLVLAVAVACWAAENTFAGAWEPGASPEGRSETDKAPGGVWLDQRPGNDPYAAPEED